MKKQHIVGRNPIRVTLEDLDALPAPYAMSFGFDLGPLCDSVRTIGLVHPPCVAKDEKEGMELVTGYRRIQALKQLGWSEVTCEDLSSTLTSPREKLLLAFHENLASRVFNAIEKAMILRRLEPFFSQHELLHRFMPLLSLPSQEAALRFYLALEGMSLDLRNAAAGGRLSLNAAKALVSLKSEDADSAFHCIIKLMLNFNQQIQFIDLMIDISEVKGKSFAAILEEEPIKAVLENSRLNKPQKAKKLLEELRTRRYPTLRKAEQRFQQKVHRLSLPEGVKIDHPAYFEAPGFRLEVPFLDGGDLMKKLHDLSLLPDLKTLGDPWLDDD